MSTPINLVPWQHKVVVEAALLKDKLRKLYDFLKTDLFNKLDDKEQGRLTRQAGLMRSYHQVLEERIAAFTNEVSDSGPLQATTVVGGVEQTAPRVTIEQIEAEIESEHYFTAGEGVVGAFIAAEQVNGNLTASCPSTTKDLKPQLNRTLFCVLQLKNGQRYTGINYGSVHADNYSAEYGRQAARKQAFEQLWTVFGFELAQKLYREKQVG